MLYNLLALSFVSHLNFTPKPGSCTAFCTEPGFVFFRAASLFVRQPLLALLFIVAVIVHEGIHHRNQHQRGHDHENCHTEQILGQEHALGQQ